MRVTEGCTFCSIWAQVKAGLQPPDLSDRPLAVYGSFYLLPDAAPLTRGHVLLVGKAHARSLARLGQSAIAEYEAIVEGLREASRPDGLLEAEHGTNDSPTSVTCIDHAHVALIPRLDGNAELLDGVLQRQLPFITLAQSLPRGRPYIFLRDGADVRLFEASKAPSQLVRKHVAESLGSDEWDWALPGRPRLVEETVEFWRDRAPSRIA